MDFASGNGSAALVHKPTNLPIRDRRSVVACLTCRRRKVRCDVTVNGSPCTNCRLDNERCMIARPKRPRKEKTTDRRHEPASSLVSRNSKAPVVLSIDSAFIAPRDSLGRSLQFPTLSAHTSGLSPHAVAYLTSQKALTLPKRSIVHTLLQYYFIRSYPIFPLIKETAFRESTQDGRSFSLLVLRAMLFAASCHIPLECAQDVGYSSIWQLRSSLYKTAKDLYDFGIEKDPLHISQAALLLAFHFDRSDPTGNTRWHAIAVQNARLVNAHQNQDLFEQSISANRFSDLKRLWWCCILGDRLLAAGTRRPASITLDQFHSIVPVHLNIDEVWDVDSEYYSGTKRNILYHLVIGACRLATIPTPAALSVGCSPDLMGPKVCIEKMKILMQEAFARLASWKDEYQPLVLDREANDDLAVAVNLHLLWLLYTSARFSLFNRHAMLCLSCCRCSREVNELCEIDDYLQGLVSLVSDTNDHIRWFAENHLLCFVPSNIQCLTTLQHALNLFWFLGEDLDQEITEPGHILRYYMDLDDDYESRYGTAKLDNILRHLVRFAIAVYDTSPSSVTKGPQRNFVNADGKPDPKALPFAEKIRLAKICHLLSLAIDYGFYTGDWPSINFDIVRFLFRRVSKRRAPNDCSSSDESVSFPGVSEPYHSPNYHSADTPGGTESSADTPKFCEDSHHASDTISTQIALPVSSTTYDNVQWPKDVSSNSTSLERFNAVTNSFSQQSMQDWAEDLEEFMAPLFGI
ncbi:hypothetical protein BDV18DRAFT_129083 [Aspergillus unguis]